MRSRTAAGLLFLILAASAVLRLWGIGYGLDCVYCRPDEDRLLATAARFTAADLNPRYFIWPSLFFYLARGGLETADGARAFLRGEARLGAPAALAAHPAPYYLAFRLAFCGLGLLTILSLYRLGKRLFSPEAGLIAALFLGASFLHGRDSRFAMLDIPAALFTVAALGGSWSIYKRGLRRDYLWAGLFCGLAVSTKYYAAAAAFPLLAAHLSRPRPRSLRRLIAAALLAALVFAISSPFLWLDFRAAAREIGGGILAPQFRTGFHLLPGLKTARGWLYHPLFSLRYGLGLPLEILALAGAVYGLARALRGAVAFRLLLSFVVPFFALLAFQKSCFLRYTTLLLPFLCLLAAEALRAAFARGKASGLLLALSALAVAAEPAGRLVRLDALLSRTDTRVQASEWMVEKLPLDSRLLFAHPLIFGRPPAAGLYPNRSALPEGTKAEEMAGLIRGLRHQGWFFILDQHPLSYSQAPPEVNDLLAREAQPLFTADPFVPSARPPVYDPFDAFYVPIDGFEGVSRPGPAIRIYWIK
jgi:4-amino-4-deoxy-L-arabinose transferase-like glycosyltransferase